MDKNRILEIISSQGWDIPETLTNRLQDRIDYLNFPFHLTRWNCSSSGETVELYRVIVNDEFQGIIREKWGRGNASSRFGCWERGLQQSLELIPELRTQGYAWGTDDFIAQF